MAKRQGIRRVDSAEVMGEDSYVEFTPIIYARAKQAAKQKDDKDDIEKADLVIDLIAGALRAWDWVGFDDAPLLLPKTGPELEEMLTVNEVQFLTREMVGSVEQRKN